MREKFVNAFANAIVAAITALIAGACLSWAIGLDAMHGLALGIGLYVLLTTILGVK